MTGGGGTVGSFTGGTVGGCGIPGGIPADGRAGEPGASATGGFGRAGGGTAGSFGVAGNIGGGSGFGGAGTSADTFAASTTGTFADPQAGPPEAARGGSSVEIGSVSFGPSTIDGRLGMSAGERAAVFTGGKGMVGSGTSAARDRV